MYILKYYNTHYYIFMHKKYIYDYNKCYKNNLGNFVSFNISDWKCIPSFLRFLKKKKYIINIKNLF